MLLGNCESEHSTKSPEKNPPKEETDTIDRTETAVTASESSEDEKHIKPNEEADENTWNVKNPSMTDPPFADPFSYQKEHLQDPAIDDQSSHDDTNDTNGNKNIGELDTSTLTEVEVAETTSGIEIPENYPTTSESVNGSNLNESKYRVETNTNGEFLSPQNIFCSTFMHVYTFVFLLRDPREYLETYRTYQFRFSVPV